MKIFKVATLNKILTETSKAMDIGTGLMVLNNKKHKGDSDYREIDLFRQNMFDVFLKKMVEENDSDLTEEESDDE